MERKMSKGKKMKNIGPCYLQELKKNRKGKLVNKHRKQVPNLELLLTVKGITETYNSHLDREYAVIYAIMGCAPSGAEYYYIIEKGAGDGPNVGMKISYYKRPGPMKWQRCEGWRPKGLWSMVKENERRN